MLNQPAFLIVPSGFSTISVWLRGRFEIGSCANAGGPALARTRAKVSNRNVRIESSSYDVPFLLPQVSTLWGLSVNRVPHPYAGRFRTGTIVSLGGENA